MSYFGDLGRHGHHGGGHHGGGGWGGYGGWGMPWPYATDIITLPSPEESARVACVNKGCEYKQEGQGFMCKCKKPMSGLAQLAADFAPSIFETSSTPQQIYNPSTGQYSMAPSSNVPFFSPQYGQTPQYVPTGQQLFQQQPFQVMPSQPSGVSQQTLIESFKQLPSTITAVKSVLSPTKTPVARPVVVQSSSNTTAILITAAVVLGIAFLGYSLYKSSKGSSSASILPSKTIG